MGGDSNLCAKCSATGPGATIYKDTVPGSAATLLDFYHEPVSKNPEAANLENCSGLI